MGNILSPGKLAMTQLYNSATKKQNVFVASGNKVEICIHDFPRPRFPLFWCFACICSHRLPFHAPPLCSFQRGSLRCLARTSSMSLPSLYSCLTQCCFSFPDPSQLLYLRNTGSRAPFNLFFFFKLHNQAPNHILTANFTHRVPTNSIQPQHTHTHSQFFQQCPTTGAPSRATRIPAASGRPRTPTPATALLLCFSSLRFSSLLSSLHS